MELLINVKTALLQVLQMPFMPTTRMSVIYLVGALLIVLLLYPRIQGVGPFSAVNFFKYVFPKEIYSHRSAKLDVAFTLVNQLLFILFIAPFLASSVIVSKIVAGQLTAFFGVSDLMYAKSWVTDLGIALLLLLPADFAVYIVHRAQHQLKVLWEFHKVHHSAEVLTPVTLYRMHPLDDILALTVGALFIGLVQGTLLHLFPTGSSPMTLYGLNVLFFLYYILGYNLRHSHIWISYGPFWSKVFISPAQHQIHHSKNPKHFDKNYGLIFAFWDHFLGSLYTPKERENIKFGLSNNEEVEYQTLGALMFLPFRKAAVRLKNGRIGPVFCYTLLAFFVIAMAFALHEPRHKIPYAVDSALYDFKMDQAEPSSLFIEDLTWPEIRYWIGQGKTTVILPSGGTEQNGPHLPMGKHNLIVRYTSERIAKNLGNALIAPTLTYVPEGGFDPPTGHMLFPGTITVSDKTFEDTIESSAMGLFQHGFKAVCLIGDSGGNQLPQKRVAERINRKVDRSKSVKVVHVSAYYDPDRQKEWLKKSGVNPADIGEHAGILETSELLAIAPGSIRTDRLHLPNAPLAQTGANGRPELATAELGIGLLNLKIDSAVKQIQETVEA